MAHHGFHQIVKAVVHFSGKRGGNKCSTENSSQQFPAAHLSLCTDLFHKNPKGYNIDQKRKKSAVYLQILKHLRVTAAHEIRFVDEYSQPCQQNQYTGHNQLPSLFLLIHSILPFTRLCNLCPEDHDGICVRAAEFRGPRRLSGNASAVAKDVDIWEGTVHSHRTDPPSVLVKIKHLAHMMSAMASHLSPSVNHCDPDLRPFLCHIVPPG